MAVTKKAKKTPATALAETSLSKALGALDKVYKDGEGSLVDIDEERLTESMPHLPTGCTVLDMIIGGFPNARGVLPCPGFPRGRVINLYGAESSGKTTLCLMLAAQTIRRGGNVMYLDFEHAVDVAYASHLGVPVSDKSRFALIQPETIEKGFTYIWAAARGGVDLIIVDSIMSGSTAAQWAQDLDEKGDTGRVGAKAAKWSEFLPGLKAVITRTNTCLVGISQLRAKIETGFGKSYGDPNQAQGGNAWKYYSELRIKLQRVGVEKGKRRNLLTNELEDVALANKVTVKLDKCKVSAGQGRDATFYVIFGEGIDDLRSILDILVARRIIKKASGWYEYTQGNINFKVNGMDALKAKVLEIPGLKEMLRETLLKTLQATTTSKAIVEEDSDDADEEEDVIPEEFKLDDDDPIGQELMNLKAGKPAIPEPVASPDGLIEL